ncbi:MAG: dephospho-CoA kinase [Kiritimatiellia bacterium]
MKQKRDKSPVTIGITGGIGCGKSAAGAALERLNVAVLDADHEAHRLMRKGTPVYNRVLEAFGPSIMGADGEIDRARLAAVVFPDPPKLELLNSLVHPAVRQSWREWAAARREEGRDAAVVIPLLYETGETEGWDAVICITAPEDAVRRRLKARGMNDRQIDERMRAQMPLEKKSALADYVALNAGTLDELECSLKAILKEIKSKRKRAL